MEPNLDHHGTLAYIARFTIGRRPYRFNGRQNTIKRIVTLVSDLNYGRAENGGFRKAGEDHAALRVPVQNRIFALPAASPEAIFVFIPGNQAGTFARQFVERGLNTSGIRLIGTGDMTDDDLLNPMGDSAIGIITAHQYSVAHDSALNKSFVAGFKQAMGMRPNFVSVAAYDGMHLIYEAIKKTGGDTTATGDRRHEGTGFGVARPGLVKPAARIVRNIYIRRVERHDTAHNIGSIPPAKSGSARPTRSGLRRAIPQAGLHGTP